MAAPYQRLSGAAESPTFRYRLAKWLTAVSLLAVVMMAGGSLVYRGAGKPSSSSGMAEPYPNTRVTTYEDHSFDEADPDIVAPKALDLAPKNTSCRLHVENLVPATPDGSYTPPAPDQTLLRAVDHAASEDYNNYCESWNPDTGFPDTMNQNDDCGTWQDKYKSLHEQRLEQLERLKAGDFESFVHEGIPDYVSYLCFEDPSNRASRGCGGLADRMSGMISVFFYALLTDRAYLAHWQDANPVLLEDLFERPNIDWSFDPDEMRKLFDSKTNSRFLTYEPLNSLNQKWGPIGRMMFPKGPSQNFKDLFNASYVEWRSNRAFVIRTFQDSTLYPEKLAQVGLTKDNAFRCITDFLFRPTIGPRRFINAYKQLFEMESVLSIGLQIRTDDSAIMNPEKDSNTLEKWDYFIKCANDLRDAKRQPHHKHVVYFLITDSAKLRDDFVSMNDDINKRRQYLGDQAEDVTMVVTGLPIEHIESKAIQHKYIHNNTQAMEHQDRAQMTAGVNSAVIENWLLSYTDYRLISRQGFGKLAAFHSKNAHTTIGMPKNERKEHAVDCSNPHSFISYDTLSTWWSLG